MKKSFDILQAALPINIELPLLGTAQSRPNQYLLLIPFLNYIVELDHEPPNRIRPLAALLLRTLLPPTLSCLLKKPCLRLFLTMEGWNVRLMNHVDKSRRSDCMLHIIDVLVAMVMAPT